MRRHHAAVVGVLAAVWFAGCGGRGPELTGTIRADGSSTVFPLTSAVVEAFGEKNPGVRIAVGVSGTTAGFDRFCRGESEIQNASRPISKTERDACARGQVAYLEIPVAHDAVTIIVHRDNDWVDALSMDELKKIWEPAAEGRVMRWADVRSSWPVQPMRLFGPGALSGTFDFFTETVVGTLDASRRDYTASEDDEVIVQGVAADRQALGYVGYGYFDRHRDTLRAVPVAGPHAGRLGPVTPSPDTVHRGIYAPLARPLFIYVNKAAMTRPDVAAFVAFYLEQDEEIVRSVGGIALSSRAYALVRQRVKGGIEGTLFADRDASVNLEVLLADVTP
jgi:phosphate transport system substrate-binding protein